MCHCRSPRTANARRARATAVAPDERVADRDRLAAAVADEDGVGRQHRHQAVHVAVARRGEEALGQRLAAAPGRPRSAAARRRRAGARAARIWRQLASLLPTIRGDLGEAVVERRRAAPAPPAPPGSAARTAAGTPSRSSPRPRRGAVARPRRAARAATRRRSLAPHARRAQHVDGQPRRDRRHERAGSRRSFRRRAGAGTPPARRPRPRPPSRASGRRPRTTSGRMLPEHCHRVHALSSEARACTSSSRALPAPSATP